MKFKLSDLAEELGITGNELFAWLSGTGYDVIDIPLRELSRIAVKLAEPVKVTEEPVKLAEPVKFTLEPVSPQAMEKAKAAEGTGEISAQQVSDMLGLQTKIFLQAIKTRRLPIAPTRSTRGPRGYHRYYFDKLGAQILLDRQEELKHEGVKSSAELKKLTGLSYGKIHNALKKFPRVKDGFLLQTRGSVHFGACRSYYKSGALGVLQGIYEGKKDVNA